VTVALVTGAARPRGIGRATAMRLARDGCDVACLDIARPYPDAPAHGVGTSDDLNNVVSDIHALGRKAVAVRADISDVEEVEEAVATATDALGTITRVASVAGGSGFGFGVGPLVSLAPPEFRRVLDVNVTGTWLVARACASRMIGAGVGGRICNVSSQAGKRAYPLIGAYCAAKAGVILLTQAMALEWGGSGISVNAVCPGTVDTDLINPGGALTDQLREQIARTIPLGRIQSADEIAATICWLLSDDAAAVTGEAVNASAGETMV
jgi:NAD(P)-dependent dehydrogenase (short-subunit alcohol dehydrogenase family)